MLHKKCYIEKGVTLWKSAPCLALSRGKGTFHAYTIYIHNILNFHCLSVILANIEKFGNTTMSKICSFKTELRIELTK